ncbi:MAG TPA: hypothetical protein VIY28_06960 [Pseudonocardiaceae bacterium]
MTPRPCAAHRSLGRVGSYSLAHIGEDTLVRARRLFGDDHSRTLKAADNLARARRLSGQPGCQGDSDPVDES